MPVLVLKIIGLLQSGLIHLQALLLPREDDQPQHKFSREEIAGLYRVVGRAHGASLDEQTWSDLLLDQYGDALASEVSLFGRQVLYRRLREGVDDAGRATVRERLALLLQDRPLLDELHKALRSLRHADTDIAALLWEAAPPAPPWWAGRTWPLPLALVACVAAVALSPLAWLGVALVMYVLISAQMRYHARIQLWERQGHSLGMLMRAHALLGERGGALCDGFVPGRELAARINRHLSRSGFSQHVPGASEYEDWFLLANVNHYFRSLALVFGQREFLRESYLLCAELEADVALARHLLAAGTWCWADAAGERSLALEHVVHPLLDEAAPLSIALEGNGAFISGQNGVGKSTFLRTCGLNLVTARAFGICYARRARTPALPVYASMQNEDSLLGGESLYIAELRRAKELLAAAHESQPAFYLIDEVFRGTNHIESVSAAAAVLDVLAERGLVIVSSHNLVGAAVVASARTVVHRPGRRGTQARAGRARANQRRRAADKVRVRRRGGAARGEGVSMARLVSRQPA